MKKNILPLLTVLLCPFAFGQVGINTQTPQSTLDVIAKGGASDIDGLQAPRITRAQLTNKGNTLYGTNQNGTLIYITDVSGGDTAGPRANIDAIGYYYFNGSIWQKIGSGGGSSTLTASNGVNISGSTVKLGGTLTDPLTKITTNGATNKLAIEGLEEQNTVGANKIITVDDQGVLKKIPANQILGSLNTSYYLQGTSVIYVPVGTQVLVPGLQLIHTVPAGKKQTLLFTLTGYATMDTAQAGGGQGVFGLYDTTTKLSSAYVSITTANGTTAPGSYTISNLPVPITMIKAITIDNSTSTTDLVKDYRVTYHNWASSDGQQALHRINYLPSSYAGYTGDNECMLSRMSVLVFNND